ncbi:MAG: NTPase [Actinophytocola sp.]|uniref:P-loop NTPase fold protein n=1 Tax=Actinophytocola sp. TaxID=1872138 RepID=UPI00132A42F1|nr:P-loop NTPase fold protein [Actinophytocola sp.]MPZ80774.1 NTPase [Actinophytocola sp.]
MTLTLGPGVDQQVPMDKALGSPGFVVVVHDTAADAELAVRESLGRTRPDCALFTGETDISTDDLAGHDHDAVFLLDPEETQELLTRAKRMSPLDQLFQRLPNTVVSYGDAGTVRELLVDLVNLPYHVIRLDAQRHVPGYHADTDAGADRLGISADVDMLADLVASRLIKPPLSIGLFGDWGSGKSFFMRRMRERIRVLADLAAAEETTVRQRGPGVSSYCSSVRQITFNAWHYVEANLWASLASHIFDNLATGDSEDDLRRRADRLGELRRTEQSLLTRLSAVRLERMMVAARHQRQPVAVDLTGDDYAWVAKELGVPDATIGDVRRFAEEVSGVKAEAKRAGTLFKSSPFAWVTLGAGLILAGVLAFVAQSPAWPVVTAVVAAVVAATPVVTKVREAAKRINRAAETDQAATGKRLAELDAETARLERAVAELAPGQDVTAFARSRGADYRQHLGVVSSLRRDLETFAAILDKERESDGGLERIVLYIDDLDRCPPDVVVKVLEAIHLLVALPVFVVVVGVDDRWLLQAVRQHYAAMLPDDVMTPADYVEKVFQIPFQLSAMDGDGFGDLVHALAGSGAAGPGSPRVLRPPVDPTADTTELGPVMVTPMVRPRQLDISAGELEFLTRLAPLVPSPRAAKRLVNLYRLLRSRLAGHELEDFVEGAGARAVLTLLAVHAGDSEAAVGLFARIGAAGTGVASWRGLLDRYAKDDDVETLCATLRTIDGMPDSLGVYREWLPLVRRFSFGHRPGH